MSPVTVRSPHGTIDLAREIEVRAQLRVELESIIGHLERGLAVESASDLDALALLLVEVIETRKSAEKQEKDLKKRLRAFFPEGEAVLSLPSVVAIVNTRERNDLDREALIADLGLDVVVKYLRKTVYEVMTVKAKGG